MFQRLSDKKEAQSTSVLIYGSKAGKSVQIATLGNRNLWICLDADGYAVAQSPWFKKSYGVVNPFVIEIFEELAQEGFHIPTESQVYDKIYHVLDYAFKNYIDEFDFVSIDSLTTLSRASLLKALDVNATTRKSQTKINIVEKLNALLPAIQDYGTEMSLVQQLIDLLISNCKKYNKTLIVTAHERLMYAKNKATGVEDYNGIRPAVTGRAQPDNITQAFSNVWYMKRVGFGVFRLYTQGDGEFLASSRNAGLFTDVIPDGSAAHKLKYPNGPNISVMLKEIRDLSVPSS
jgi:hypothetical protein